MPSRPAPRPHPHDPIATLQARLALVIEQRTQGVSDCTTAIPSVSFFRREAPAPPAVCLLEPSVVLVARGVKRLLVGGEGYGYDIHRFLITSLDIPANSEVVEASSDRPCVGLTFKLDIRLLAELIAHGGLTPGRAGTPDRSVGVGRLTPPLLEPFARLLGLLDEPAAIPVLAPSIEREIHYRLLQSEQATRLWQIASIGSQSHRIARAIDWLKVHYAETLRVEALAAMVQMSTSSLHHHFRQLTAMSPLQYQKWLRLNEARRLMLGEGSDAATAAFSVGYESPSQFSREYSRLFGAPPRRDVEGVRSRIDDGRRPQLMAGRRGLESSRAARAE